MVSFFANPVQFTSKPWSHPQGFICWWAEWRWTKTHDARIFLLINKLREGLDFKNLTFFENSPITIPSLSRLTWLDEMSHPLSRPKAMRSHRLQVESVEESCAFPCWTAASYSRVQLLWLFQCTYNTHSATSQLSIWEWNSRDFFRSQLSIQINNLVPRGHGKVFFHTSVKLCNLRSAFSSIVALAYRDDISTQWYTSWMTRQYLF